MFLVQCCIILGAIVSCLGENETNEISYKKENDKLDVNLRKALLKALDELQSEKSLNASVEKLNPQSVITSSFSSIADETSTSASISTTTTTTSTQPKVVIQQSNGYQHKPIISFVPTSVPNLDPINDAEQIVTSASNSFTRSPKYQSSKSDIILNNPFLNNYNKNLISITEKSRITPSLSTTTAVPIITSSTEENEAKVENIQFFQAPLVAAFTVHHDEIGLPKKVEALYRTSSQSPAINQDFTIKPQLIPQKQLQSTSFKQDQQIYKVEQLKLQQYLQHQEQMRRQTDLQEKQKLLEQQIQKLQQVQYHQDYSLRQQQLLHEQKLLQQRQELLEQQKLLFKTTQPNTQTAFTNNFSSLGNSLENRIIQNYLGKSVTSSSVTLQPSISFQSSPQIHNTLLPPLPPANLNKLENYLNTQFPPVASKDFSFRQSQQPIINSNFGTIPQQFLPPLQHIQNNFQANKPAQNIYNFQNTQSPTKNLEVEQLRIKNVNNDQFSINQKGNSFQTIRGLENFDVGKNVQQSNRVFRHESGTGNFVNNNYNNNYNNFNNDNNGFTSTQSNRYFRSNSNNFGNYYTNQNFRPAIDENLNKLLYYSGINLGKQNEDLNIVSKVLSLNHFGGNNYFSKSQYLKPSYKNIY